jgi:hypothetical protein
VFELAEEAFDEIAPPIEGRIDRADDAHVALARDVRGAASSFDEFND